MELLVDVAKGALVLSSFVILRDDGPFRGLRRLAKGASYIVVSVRISDATLSQSLRDMLTLSPMELYPRDDGELCVVMPGFPEETEQKIVSLLVEAWRRERNINVQVCVTIVADEDEEPFTTTL